MKPTKRKLLKRAQRRRDKALKKARSPKLEKVHTAPEGWPSLLHGKGHWKIHQTVVTPGLYRLTSGQIIRVTPAPAYQTWFRGDRITVTPYN